ncbi:MAG TPA: hypothetical protein VFF30_04575 [Nitrososphaerales archaeon]|nr:hypothetical protein [Nitrososphaerales archaeon]
MPEFMGLEISGASLALRMVLASLSAAASFAIYYYVPANIGNLVSSYIPSTVASGVSGILAGFVSPFLLIIGLLIAVFSFLSILLKGTKIYGVVVMMTGALFAIYTYLVFQGGSISVNIPQSSLIQNVSGSIQVQLSLLMLLFILPSLLTVVKGGLILASANRED